VVDCEGAVHVFQIALMVDQAHSRQESRGISCDILAINDLGTGSGWQQSKQNQVVLAVA